MKKGSGHRAEFVAFDLLTNLSQLGVEVATLRDLNRSLDIEIINGTTSLVP